jgi:hypothetical protein
MQTASPEIRGDFIARHAKDGGVFSVLRRMRESDALTNDDVAFRKLTLASDLLERA